MGCLDRPQTPEGDPETELHPYRGLRPRLPLSLAVGSGIPMQDRTRFVDQEVLQAIAQGIAQVIIVGSGYDGRCLRFRKQGIRFFEVDHPATQADKRRRLEAVGAAVDHVTFVATDWFRTASRRRWPRPDTTGSSAAYSSARAFSSTCHQRLWNAC